MVHRVIFACAVLQVGVKAVSQRGWQHRRGGRRNAAAEVAAARASLLAACGGVAGLLAVQIEAGRVRAASAAELEVLARQRSLTAPPNAW